MNTSISNSNHMNNKPHAILVTLPSHENIISSVQLAIKLASKGVSITFVNTEHIHHEIIHSNPAAADSGVDIFVEALTSSGLDIEYMTVPDGLPLGFDRLSNLEEAIGATTHCFPAHLEVAVAKIMRSRPTTCCLIADTNLGLTTKVAEKFGLVYVSFCSEAAMVLNCCFHLHLLMENGHIGPGSSVRNDVIDYIPGITSIKRTDLKYALQEEDLTTIRHWNTVNVIETAKRADFILGNSIQELEAHSIEVIQGMIPYYAIGPLLPLGLTNGSAAMRLWAESDCINWLDSRPAGSVLYVAFGNIASIDKEELEEIANGIKLSGVSFLWVVPSDMTGSNDLDLLPIGFKDEVGDRGMIVPWTRQTAVLSHHAIGGFLSQCGWNSTLESIWYEVPLICFPLAGDQFTNRKLVVDEWKIGCNLCEAKPVIRVEVLQKIKDLLGGFLGYDEFNANIKEIKRILEITMTTNGSSDVNADNFIKDMMNASNAKKRLE